MTPSEFKSEIKRLKGGYLLCGDEDYLKRSYFEMAENSLVEEGDAFNHISFNYDTYSPEALSQAIDALPLMSDHKMIELYDMRLNSMAKGPGKEQEVFLRDFCSLCENIPKDGETVLIFYFAAEEIDVKSSVFSSLSKVLTPVIFDRESPSRLAGWIAKHFAAEKILASSELCVKLAEICGCDMYALTGEIVKLSALCHSQGRDRLEDDDIESFAGKNIFYADFDFSDALSRRDGARAFEILGQYRQKKYDELIVMGTISTTVSNMYLIKLLMNQGLPVKIIADRLKMHPYRIEKLLPAINRRDINTIKKLLILCENADLMLKSGSTDKYTVLETLTAEVISL